jgi:cellulose biosynthesis protein BcsE
MSNTPIFRSGPRLALPGLSERVQQLSRGMIYGIAVDQQSIRVPLLASCVLASVQSGNVAVMLSASEPSALVRKAKLAGVDLAPALASGQLRLFRHKLDAAKQMFQAGPERLVHELAKYTVGPRSLIVFDQADPFFLLSDPKQALEASSLYAQWAEENEHTLVAAFAPAVQAPRDYITLRTVAEGFAGFAVVRTGEDAPSIEIRHWFGEQGASPRAVHTLEFDPQGQLRAIAPTGGQGAIASNEEQFIATRAAIDDFGSDARHWRAVETTLDALDAARKLKAGTVLLHFSRVQDFRALCQVVAAIRVLNRPQVRVVVRETGSQLRLAHMMALLRLGVSFTLSKAMPPAQAQMTLNTLRGTLLAREVSTDVEKTIAETTASFTSPIVEFEQLCSLVEGALSLSDQVALPHTLVRLGLQGIGGDRLASIASRRGARDMLMAVHDDSLWLFLFGCNSADSETVLARLFGRNFERLFMGFSRVEGSQEKAQ